MPLRSNTPSVQTTERGKAEFQGGRRSRLRVGAVVDSPRVPAWVGQVLADIQEADFADLDVIIRQQRSEALRKRFRPSELSSLLFRLYVLVDSRIFRLRRDALAWVDLSTVPGAPAIVDAADSQDAISTLLDDFEFEVLLNLGSATKREGWEHKVRYGVWTVTFGAGRAGLGDSALFWEIFQRNPVSGSTLEVSRVSPPESFTLYRSYSKTSQTSLYRNRNATCWKTAQFVKRCLRDLDRLGPEFLETNRTCHQTGQTQQTPGNLKTAWFLLRQGAHLSRRACRRLLSRDKWFISLTRRDAEDSQPTLVLPPAGRFYADPFLIEKDATDYLFFEDYLERERRGVISCLRVGEDGTTSDPQVVLDTGHHLSYPFIFEFEGQIYLMPESAACGQLRLYRATEFPFRWELESVLLDDVQAYDPTLHFDSHKGKYWLFANIKVSGGSSLDELCLFWADSPLGPWTPHPQNPVVTDVQRARPAGRLFRDEGQLIRPSQDCSVSYGHAIQLNRVTTLSETDYREEVVDQITADWIPEEQARHTINFSRRFCAMDHKVSLARGMRHDPFKGIRYRMSQVVARVERSWV